MRIFIFLGIAIPALLSSCCPPTSLYPLSPPENAQYDSMLGGTWIPADEEDEGYLHVGKVENGMTGVLVVTIEKNGELEYNAFTVFPTMTPKGNFLNVKAENVFEKLPRENQGYLLVRYELRDRDSLSIYYMDKDLFSKAIQEQRLKGVVTYEKISLDNGEEGGQEGDRREIECVRITDTSENLLHFIMDNDVKLLFPEEVKLRRLDSFRTPAN